MFVDIDRAMPAGIGLESLAAGISAHSDNSFFRCPSFYHRMIDVLRKTAPPTVRHGACLLSEHINKQPAHRTHVSIAGCAKSNINNCTGWARDAETLHTPSESENAVCLCLLTFPFLCLVFCLSLISHIDKNRELNCHSHHVECLRRFLLNAYAFRQRLSVGHIVRFATRAHCKT